jgi:hypothetical protein
MVEGNAKKTKSGNLKRAELHIVCEWVLADGQKLIRRLFGKCYMEGCLYSVLIYSFIYFHPQKIEGLLIFGVAYVRRYTVAINLPLAYIY